jgi:hypothetical protein
LPIAHQNGSDKPANAVIYIPVNGVTFAFCVSEKNTLAFAIRTVTAVAPTDSVVMVLVAG